MLQTMNWACLIKLHVMHSYTSGTMESKYMKHKLYIETFITIPKKTNSEFWWIE